MKKKNENITIEKLSTSAFQNHQKKDLKVAEKLYKEVLKINPNYATAYSNLGTIFSLLENLQKAKVSYDKSLSIGMRLQSP